MKCQFDLTHKLDTKEFTTTMPSKHLTHESHLLNEPGVHAEQEACRRGLNTPRQASDTLLVPADSPGNGNTCASHCHIGPPIDHDAHQTTRTITRCALPLTAAAASQHLSCTVAVCHAPSHCTDRRMQHPHGPVPGVGAILTL